MFRKVNRIHFVGIGGIGMSGIAELLLNLGFSISGSDLADSEIVQKLIKKGAVIHKGHSGIHIDGCDVVVYSSAVREDNPEIIAAREQNITIIKRAEMLGELIALKETSIAVGGTHGKTTTSSMIGYLLSATGFDPTLVVGGLVSNINTNSQLGSGEVIVVEADEYDRSFLALRPTISIVTNIELEHTDCYADIHDLQSAFVQFCNSVPFYGVVIACLDSPGIQAILSEVKRPIVTYGFSNQSDFRAEHLRFSKERSIYQAVHHKKILGDIELSVPGEHNILNSLAALALGIELGLGFDEIREGLMKYEGVRRRFDIKGIARDIMVVDDYAHHPTEVRATLSAARQGWDRRIVAVFQPHLYTRTRDFYREFATAFLECDQLIVLDVYPAREAPIPGITGKIVAEKAKELGHKNVTYVEDIEDLIPELGAITRPNDMVITLGAGHVWRYSETFYKSLENSE